MVDLWQFYTYLLQVLGQLDTVLGKQIIIQFVKKINGHTGRKVNLRILFIYLSKKYSLPHRNKAKLNNYIVIIILAPLNNFGVLSYSSNNQ